MFVSRSQKLEKNWVIILITIIWLCHLNNFFQIICLCVCLFVNVWNITRWIDMRWNGRILRYLGSNCCFANFSDFVFSFKMECKRHIWQLDGRTVVAKILSEWTVLYRITLTSLRLFFFFSSLGWCTSILAVKMIYMHNVYFSHFSIECYRKWWKNHTDKRRITLQAKDV